MLPAFNEEHCLPPLLRRFAKLFRERRDFDAFIVVVDDGSSDRTAEIARAAGRRGPVRLVQHERNRGLGEAIKTGLRACLEAGLEDSDYIVCMDADNTHPPSTVPAMEEVAEREGADIVIASRYRRGSRQVGVPLHRQAMSAGALLLFMAFLRLPGVRDYTCGFRLYRAGLVRRGFEAFGDDLITRSGFACTDQLLVNYARLGATIREVPFVLRYDRKVGESKLQLGATILETFKLLAMARRELDAGPPKARSSS